MTTTTRSEAEPNACAMLGHAMAYLNEQNPRNVEAVEILNRAWGQVAKEWAKARSAPVEGAE